MLYLRLGIRLGGVQDLVGLRVELLLRDALPQWILLARRGIPLVDAMIGHAADEHTLPVTGRVKR